MIEPKLLDDKIARMYGMVCEVVRSGRQTLAQDFALHAIEELLADRKARMISMEVEANMRLLCGEAACEIFNIVNTSIPGNHYVDLIARLRAAAGETT